MKKLALASSLLSALCALTFAGPEPLPESKNPVVEVPTERCFDGWYFGVHGGALLEDFNRETSADVTADIGAGFFFDSDHSSRGDNQSSGEAGLHIGYNFQRGGWVFGIEVDASLTNFEEDGFAFAATDPPGQSAIAAGITSRTDVDWYSTVRPRIGHTLGQRLYVFGTGGLALGLVDVSEVTAISGHTGGGPAGVILQPPLSDGDKSVEFGWTAGGGFDICLTHHVILNFTYLYVDLGDKSASTSFITTSPNGADTFTGVTSVRSDLKFHVFEGGLSFRF